MSDIKRGIISAEELDECQVCGKIAETRPYGIGGKRICFEYGMKDRQGTEKRFNELMDGPIQ